MFCGREDHEHVTAEGCSRQLWQQVNRDCDSSASMLTRVIRYCRSYSYLRDDDGDVPFDKLDVCAAEEYSIGGEAQRPRGSRAWPRAAWSVPGDGRCVARFSGEGQDCSRGRITELRAGADCTPGFVVG